MRRRERVRAGNFVGQYDGAWETYVCLDWTCLVHFLHAWTIIPGGRRRKPVHLVTLILGYCLMSKRKLAVNAIDEKYTNLFQLHRERNEIELLGLARNCFREDGHAESGAVKGNHHGTANGNKATDINKKRLSNIHSQTLCSL